MSILRREDPPVPITIIGGFLGAGKTTLLNRIIERASGRRLGLLVNDFGEVNIDSKLVVGTSAEGVISLANGCVCCSIKNDVVRALFQLLESAEKPEHVILETSGISNPGAVVDTFVELARSGVVRIDGVVTVADAVNFRGLDKKKGGLAWCQIVAADLIVLSKIDLAGEDEARAVEAEIRGLAPSARVIRASFGDVPLQVLLSVGGARELEAHDDHDHHGDHDHHDHPPEDHGFASFSFSCEEPLVFAKLVEVLKNLPTSIVRAKGIVQLIERPGDLLALHLVGRRIDVKTIGPASGERSQLVLIGLAGEFDAEEIRARLTACRRPPLS